MNESELAPAGDASFGDRYESLPVGIYRATPDGRLLDANGFLVRLLAAPDKATLLATSFADVHADANRWREWRDRMERLGEVRDFEVRARCHDGGLVWVRHSAKRVTDDDGHTRWYEGVLEDVTERRAAEDALRHSEALLSAVFDALDEAVILVTWPDRRILRVNRACERIFGHRASDLMGESTEILHVDREHFERFGKRLADAFGSGSAATFDFEMRRRDGEVFPTEHHVDLLLDANGNAVAGVAITRDVSARQRAEADLAMARDALHRGEKLAALGSLVAGVAHEIRTPLAYISNHAHLVERRGNETADGAPLVEDALAIMDGVERINSLVAGLRRFTRMDADERAPRELSAVAREAVDVFAATHVGHPRLDLDLRRTPEVPMDALQIQQVVLNLLQNAADTAGGRVRVATRSAGDGGALLEVRDEGPGMPEDVRRRVFEPFFTTKPEGMGLGLAIVRRIVDAHGGTIECESAPGKGTTFRVLLPGHPQA